MKRFNFTTHINASPGKVWNVLWEDATYRQWTSAFNEGSYAESDWKKGGSIKFLSPKGDGIYSIIEDLIPEKLMAFTHQGMIKEGIEQPQDDETKEWVGSKEIYVLKESHNGTDLEVSLDSTDDFADYFAKTYPVALEKIKNLAES